MIISLLVALVVFCLIYWAAMKLLAAFGIGNPIAALVQVVLVILFVLWLINALGGLGLGLKLR